MRYYYPETPQGKLGEVKIGYAPAKAALARTNKENASASSILLLTHDTTELEVAAATGSTLGIAGKWLSQATVDSSVAGTSVITGAALGPNWDFIVPNGQIRRVVVPIATNVQTSGSVMGANRKYGLYPAVAFKTFVGTGSVLTAEF